VHPSLFSQVGMAPVCRRAADARHINFVVHDEAVQESVP